jgi:hypothetical protein
MTCKRTKQAQPEGKTHDVDVERNGKTWIEEDVDTKRGEEKTQIKIKKEKREKEKKGIYSVHGAVAVITFRQLVIVMQITADLTVIDR